LPHSRLTSRPSGSFLRAQHVAEQPHQLAAPGRRDGPPGQERRLRAADRGAHVPSVATRPISWPSLGGEGGEIARLRAAMPSAAKIRAASCVDEKLMIFSVYVLDPAMRIGRTPALDVHQAPNAAAG
jgi:hypothetical protein